MSKLSVWWSRQLICISVLLIRLCGQLSGCLEGLSGYVDCPPRFFGPGLVEFH